MAIERCPNGHVYDRDWNTECPRCLMTAMTVKQPTKIEFADRQTDLIRRLVERYPFDGSADSRDLYDKCQREMRNAIMIGPGMP